MPCEVDNPYSMVQEKRILCNREAPVVDDQNHKVIFLFVLVFLHFAVMSFQKCILIGHLNDRLSAIRLASQWPELI